MADLQILPDYKYTEWANYVPPSIDQKNLRNIEDTLLLNRNTLNEIIRRLGIRPASTSDGEIYDNPIYTTLIDHKKRITKLENDKLDKSLYLSQLGNFDDLITSSPKTLVNAINNRLRKDADDSSAFSYTFKKLTLNGGTSTDLSVSGGASIGGKLTVTGTSSMGAITSSGRSSFEDLTVRNTALVYKKLEVGDGIAVTGDSTVSGTLTVTNLRVTGNITCDNTITGNSITANGDLWAKGNCKTNGAFYSTQEFIQFHWNSSPTHTLYVHGGSRSLSAGDAHIRTVG